MSDTMAEALRARVLSSGDVTAVVDQRMYPIYHPQGKPRPSIVYDLVTADRLDGSSGGLVESEWNLELQFDGPNDYLKMKALGKHVYEVMENFQGVSQEVFVRGVFLQDEQDDYRQPTDGSAEGVQINVQTWRIFYREIVPRSC